MRRPPGVFGLIPVYLPHLTFSATRTPLPVTAPGQTEAAQSTQSYELNFIPPKLLC